MKKLLSGLIAIVFVFSFVSLIAAYADQNCECCSDCSIQCNDDVPTYLLSNFESNLLYSPTFQIAANLFCPVYFYSLNIDNGSVPFASVDKYGHPSNGPPA